MRYIPLIYQNTKAWNGLSQEDKDVVIHAVEAKEALAGYCIVDVATPGRAGGEEC